jgi:uncharacterized membrane protein
MNKIRNFWLNVRDSMWFIPAVMLCGSLVMAWALIEAQSLGGSHLAEAFPRMFGAGAEGARSMLSAIATSMITVAGVVFSIVIVALSLAASQYSPQVLRNFMSDRTTQVVLGAFVAVFSYCLIVLRTIRGPEEGDFVPSMAVFGGVVLALIAVGLLIYFIHHAASAIQVTSIVGRISSETEGAIEEMFPSDRDPPRPGDAEAGATPSLALPDVEAWETRAPRSGYLVTIDIDGLLEAASRKDRVIEVVPRVGEFILRGEALCRVFERVLPSDKTSDKTSDLGDCFDLRPERTVRQDVGHGLQQLVDVALKALSPGVHDPGTAIVCIHQIGHLMALLAARPTPDPQRKVDGQLRLVLPAPDFDDLLRAGFDPLVRSIATHAHAYAEVISILVRVGAAARDESRRAALRLQLDGVALAVEAAELPALARSTLQTQLAHAHRRLNAAATNSSMG